MIKLYSFADTEKILLTALNLSKLTIKDISAGTNIKINTLYKWKSSGGHLSPNNQDRLLEYMLENDNNSILLAETALTALNK